MGAEAGEDRWCQKRARSRPCAILETDPNKISDQQTNTSILCAFGTNNYCRLLRSTAQKNDQSNHPEGDNCADGNPHPAQKDSKYCSNLLEEGRCSAQQIRVLEF